MLEVVKKGYEVLNDTYIFIILISVVAWLFTIFVDKKIKNKKIGINLFTYIILPIDFIIFITVILDEFNWYKIITYLLIFLVIANIIIPISSRELDVEQAWKNYKVGCDINDAMEYKEFRTHYFYEHKNNGKISLKLLSLLSLITIILILKNKMF